MPDAVVSAAMEEGSKPDMPGKHDLPQNESPAYSGQEKDIDQK
jgi:hypothetical protein